MRITQLMLRRIREQALRARSDVGVHHTRAVAMQRGGADRRTAAGRHAVLSNAADLHSIWTPACD